VTGWQGNEGGYGGGGWNPQQDPYGGQQYGGGQQFGPDPSYGGDQQSGQYPADPYYTGRYPTYQGGFGGGFPPEGPPPKRSKLPVVLSIVAILAVVGTVVTIVLLNRSSGEEPVAGPGPSSSPSRPKPPSSSKPPASTSRQPTTSRQGPTKDGWTTIAMADGSYQVPPDWQKSAERRDTGLGVTFTDGAVVGKYSCGGNDKYFRGFVASGDVQGKDGAQLDINKAVTDFGNAFATRFYNQPKVELGRPNSTTIDGKRAVSLTAKVTVTPAKPECDAATGEVAIVGVEFQKNGKPAGIKMVAVVNDLSGGPANPPALPDSLAEEILETVSVG
jgi:hypothetical protein